MPMNEPTKAEILAELKRELKMRERVYPKWIKAGTLAAPVAALRIAAIRAASLDFEKRYFGEQPGLDL